MQKIEIPLSKLKLILMFIGCSIFIVLSVNFALTPEKYSSYICRNLDFIRIFGIIASILCSAAWIFFPVKLFDKKPGLILDENGIYDNSSAISLGTILWKDIVSIRSEKVKSTKFLLIYVINPEEYLNSKSKLNKILLNANMKMYDTPIAISSVGLKCDFVNLEKIIKNSYNNYLKSQSEKSQFT